MGISAIWEFGPQRMTRLLQDEDDCFERKRGMKLLEPELSFKAAFTMNIL